MCKFSWDIEKVRGVIIVTKEDTDPKYGFWDQVKALRPLPSSVDSTNAAEFSCQGVFDDNGNLSGPRVLVLSWTNDAGELTPEQIIWLGDRIRAGSVDGLGSWRFVVHQHMPVRQQLHSLFTSFADEHLSNDIYGYYFSHPLKWSTLEEVSVWQLCVRLSAIVAAANISRVREALDIKGDVAPEFRQLILDAVQSLPASVGLDEFNALLEAMDFHRAVMGIDHEQGYQFNDQA